MTRRRILQLSLALAIAAIASLAVFSAVEPQTALAARRSESADPEHFKGREVFDRLLEQAQNEGWRRLPIGERVGRIGLALRETPYVASTLEIYDDREVVSADLTGLDCVTFFESALGFARMLEKGESTPAALMGQIEGTRYRGGMLGDYVSRLHYTTDWFYDNQQKGVVTDITKELPGAVRFDRTIDFMSTHPDAYRQLKANPSLVPRIREVEDRINARRMYYIPKAKVAAIESKLKTGDIIAVTTTIPGIDASHTGMIVIDDLGRARYLHASSTHKKVWLDTTVSGYLASVSKHTGIMVARPKK